MDDKQKTRLLTHVLLSLLAAAWLLSGCKMKPQPGATEMTFGQDVQFLKTYTSDTFVLSQGQSMVAVTTDYQGRVMTSSAGGMDGSSYGWINYDLIKTSSQGNKPASDSLEAHIHVFGGEDRFWLGPEGGQFSIFFKPGTEFVFDDWYTPTFLDTDAYTLASKTDTSATFTKEIELVNYSGTKMNLAVNRDIRLLDSDTAADRLGKPIPESVKMVAFETENTITNTGSNAWTTQTGMLSIWILGMFKPSDTTTIAIPIKVGDESTLGYKVNDNYFGDVPAERLKSEENIVYFKGDGNVRSKIGVHAKRSKGVAASYDSSTQHLTMTMYNLPEKYTGYVNSAWELQEKPFDGDAINSYNDGPVEAGGDQLGPFYELETSSPAADLKPGEHITHRHTTIHLQGQESVLNEICKHVLGVEIEQIKTALP